METIKYNDIDFSKLKKLDIRSFESDIYLDYINKKVYKIFKENIDAYELTLKWEKLKILETKKVIDSIVVPDGRIVDSSFCGVREDYIDGIDLAYTKEKYSDNEILQMLLNISKDIKCIHESGIIISDLNLANIRIDKNMCHHFMDVLSYSINKLPATTTTQIILDYLKRVGKKFKISENNDKLAFLLHTIQLLVDKEFFEITDYEFEEKMERLNILRELKEIFYDLRKYYISDAPYLHELIKG